MNSDKEALIALQNKWENLRPFPKDLKLSKQQDNLFKEIINKYPAFVKQRGYDQISKGEQIAGLEPMRLYLDKAGYTDWLKKTTQPVYYFNSVFDVDYLEYIELEIDPETQRVKCIKYDDIIINENTLKRHIKEIDQI